MKNNTEKIRLLVVTSTFPRWPDDDEPAFVFELCNRLYQNGFEIDVIAPHIYGAKKKEAIDGVTVYRYQYFFSKLQSLGYNGGILACLRKNPLNYFLIPFFIFSQVVAVYRLARINQYDIIHAHWIIPQGFVCTLVNLLLGKHSIPLVCTSHGTDIYSLNGIIMKRLKQWILGKNMYLCIVSQAMQEFCLKNYLIQNNISMIPMGVDLNKSFIKNPNIERKSRRLIFVGRLIESKGIFTLIDALKIVRDEISDVELLLVGKGQLNEALKEKIYKEGLTKNVIFYGSANQKVLPALYSTASIAVVPSTGKEGFGLVLVEAMGCECAVVASSLEAYQVLIKDNVNGLLAEPGNHQDLADKIIRILRDEKFREKLAKKGRESVLEKYGWETSVKKYSELFKSIINKHNY